MELWNELPEMSNLHTQQNWLILYHSSENPQNKLYNSGNKPSQPISLVESMVAHLLIIFTHANQMIRGNGIARVQHDFVCKQKVDMRLASIRRMNEWEGEHCGELALRQCRLVAIHRLSMSLLFVAARKLRVYAQLVVLRFAAVLASGGHI